MANGYASLHSKVRRHPAVTSEVEFALSHNSNSGGVSASDLEKLIVNAVDCTLNLLKADVDLRKELLDV